MNKHVRLAVMVGIAVLALTSCGRPASPDGSASPEVMSPSAEAEATDSPGTETWNGTESSPEITPESSPEIIPESSPESSPDGGIASSGQAQADTTGAGADGVITLESVKQAALAAGYAAEDIPAIDVHQEPVPVRGIYVNYADDTYQSQCPVYEFKDDTDTMAFARQVNDAGYSRCIVNGKLLAMTEAKYGVILHDSEKAVLESFLAGSFLPYAEPAAPPVSQDKDYAGAASRIGVIQKAIDKLVNRSVVLHMKSLPEEDAGMLQSISFSLVNSADLSATASLCEDQAEIDSVIGTWQLYGCEDVKILHDKPHDYTMTGKRAGMDSSFAIHCVYSPEKDSLSLVDKDGKDYAEFFEFVSLGQDRYAFQTLYERAVVSYRDGEITSLAYSLKPRSRELAYQPGKDPVFPDGNGVADAWVLAAGEDAFEQLIAYDGAKLQLSAVDFTGTKRTYEVNVQKE